jgi:hypothetical protein
LHFLIVSDSPRLAIDAADEIDTPSKSMSQDWKTGKLALGLGMIELRGVNLAAKNNFRGSWGFK